MRTATAPALCLDAEMIFLRHGQSEFNVVYSVTRRDPGIRDPRLTEEGRRQAKAAAATLRDAGVEALVASPYIRALETAEIVAGELDLPITVEPLVGERVAFACDLGSAPAQLRARWPHLALDHLGEQWWPQSEESEASLRHRCERFRALITQWAHWRRVAIVTHWGFIRGFTGLAVPNGALLRVDPHRPELSPEPLAPFN